MNSNASELALKTTKDLVTSMQLVQNQVLVPVITKPANRSITVDREMEVRTRISKEVTDR